MKSTHDHTLASSSLALQTRSKEDEGEGTISTTIFGGTNENSVILQHNHQIRRDVISKSTLDVRNTVSDAKFLGLQ